jgi:peptidoglycan/LPS O-acetylase OafA/YrhL
VRPLTYQEYESQRFFGPLDGLRAISVLMVVMHHLPEKGIWAWLNGWAGVGVFFVISGFLITTLCIREMSRSGSERRLSLSGFYIKRFFRIVPLYVVALAAYGVLTGLWGVTGTWEQYVDKLPYYLTMNGDLVHGLPFHISWSLGIEEKFYVVWPMLLVVTRFLPRPLMLAGTVGLAVAAVGAGQVWEYPEKYAGILMGCALAIALHEPRLFAVFRRAASMPGVGLVLAVAVAASVACQPRFNGQSVGLPGAGLVADCFTPAVVAMLGYVVLHPHRPVPQVLSRGVLQWIGKRSYAIYLFHAMTIHVVDLVVEPNASSALVSASRVVVVLAVSLAIADVAHRLIEKPLNAFGHRLVKERKLRGVPAMAPASRG